MCVHAVSASSVHVGVVMFRYDKLLPAVFQTHTQRQDNKHVPSRHGLQIGAGHLAFYWFSDQGDNKSISQLGCTFHSYTVNTGSPGVGKSLLCFVCYPVRAPKVLFRA